MGQLPHALSDFYSSHDQERWDDYACKIQFDTGSNLLLLMKSID